MSDRILSEAVGVTLSNKIKENASGISTIGQGVLALATEIGDKAVEGEQGTPATGIYKYINDYVSALESRIATLEAASSTPGQEGASGIATMFTIGLADTYYLDTADSAQSVVSSALNINGFVSQIGTSGVTWKKPSVDISTITWSENVDDNYDLIGSGNVSVSFGEAGTLTKTVSFKCPGPGKVYACMLSDPTTMIDTGIQGNYAYKYHCKGHPIAGNQCVLLDSFVSTSARATARILSGSNKVQHMWSANREVTGANAGMDFKKMFEFIVGANYIKLIQGSTEYEPTITGHIDSGSVGANIMLMGSTSANLGNSVLSFAEIIDETGNIIAHYSPYKIQDSEVVIVNTPGLTAQQIYDIVENGDGAEYASRIMRPDSGYLIEITQAEDAA